MSGPIKPKEVESRKAASMPQAVFEVFNNLIVANWTGGSATVMQKDAATAISTALGISTTEVCERGFLDIEGAYRKAGWNVKYDKPGFNETYDAYFVFSKH